MAGIVALLLTGGAPAAERPPGGAEAVSADPSAALEAAAPLPGPDQPATLVETVLGLALLLGAPAALVLLWWGDVLRPGSFARLGARRPSKPGEPGQRDPRLAPPAMWLIGGLAIFLTQWFVVAVLGTLVPRDAAGEPELSMRSEAVLGLAMFGAASVMGVVIARLLRAGAGPGAGLEWGLTRREAGRSIGYAAAALACALPICHGVSVISSLIVEALTGAPPDAIAHSTLERLVEEPEDPWRIGVMLAAVLLAPLAEELVFRMGLQSAIASAFAQAAGPGSAARGRWAAISIASALFAAMHYGSVPPHGLPTLFALSVGLGIAYERTGRLIVPVAMHAGFNAWNVALVMVIGGGG